HFMSFLSFLTLFVFFFQAEDGIRDFHVTGVQTCALPILQATGCAAAVLAQAKTSARGLPARAHCSSHPRRSPPLSLRGASSASRSEERRVGKECRSRWSAYR